MLYDGFEGWQGIRMTGWQVDRLADWKKYAAKFFWVSNNGKFWFSCTVRRVRGRLWDLGLIISWLHCFCYLNFECIKFFFFSIIAGCGLSWRLWWWWILHCILRWWTTTHAPKKVLDPFTLTQTKNKIQNKPKSLILIGLKVLFSWYIINDHNQNEWFCTNNSGHSDGN